MENRKLLQGLAAGTGFALSLANSMTIYHLMDRAGMYVQDSDGVYSQLQSLEGACYQLSAGSGTLALLLGGFYVAAHIRDTEEKKVENEPDFLEIVKDVIKDKLLP
jgi:hypothetical protein